MTRNQAAQPPNIIVDTKSGETLRQMVSQVYYYPSSLCRTYGAHLISRVFVHALTGVAIAFRPFGPKQRSFQLGRRFFA
jgi:hypothetical protein